MDPFEITLEAGTDITTTVWLRDFNADKRKQLAKSGKAMPDGSFPIENEEDLKNAIKLAGNSKNPGAAKAHIRKRAAALGKTNMIPDSWKSGGKKAASETLHILRPAYKFSHNATSGLTWIQWAPYGSWDHPVYGTIDMTPQRAANFKKNFDDRVMQQEVPWGYDHGEDKAKGNRIAGTIEEVDIRDDGLWAGVKLTPTALKELQDGEWLYCSPEYKDEWTSQVTGETHADVMWGGTFTNYPFLKGIAPINMSEVGAIVAEVADKEHSEPGTGVGGEPAPRTDYDRLAPAPPATPPNPDPTVTPPGGFPPQQYTSNSSYSGNTTGNLIFSEGGVNRVDEDKLRELLGLDKDADITVHLSELKRDAEVTRIASAAADKAKKFADAFPDEAKRLNELADRDRRNEAKKFAENLTAIKTESGRTVRLSPAACEKAEELALKFSEGSVSIEDFGEMLQTIASTGVVELGERGSSINPEDDGNADPTAAATRLSDMAKAKVQEALAEGKELSLVQASEQVARDNPELFAQYRRGVPTGANR